MKHLKKISVLAAVLVMVSMILASCGGGGMKDDPAVGTWEMTEVEPAHSPSWVKMGKVLFPLEKATSMTSRMIPIRL